MFKFTAVMDTDNGTVKEINQDSLLIKHASWSGGEILLAIICDGMGGLSRGELASSVAVRAFASWFEEEVIYSLPNPDLEQIGDDWNQMLKDLNSVIGQYTLRNNQEPMGTTFTAILLVNDRYLIGHVGDTRIYTIGDGVTQQTEDHTYIAREIKKGIMTEEEARNNKHKNMLLQCIGASETVEPQIIMGQISEGVYLVCSDGFRHELSEDEMYKALNSRVLADKDEMTRRVRELIELNKDRGERDNISAIVIKAEQVA